MQVNIYAVAYIQHLANDKKHLLKWIEIIVKDRN